MVTILHNSVSYVVWYVWKLDGYISCTIRQVMMQDSILNFLLCVVHNQRSSCEWDDGHSEGSCGELITSCRKIWLCAKWCSHVLWKPKVLKLQSPKFSKMFCLLGHLFRLCVQQLYKVLKTLELTASERNLNMGDAYWIMQSTSTLEYDGSSHLRCWPWWGSTKASSANSGTRASFLDLRFATQQISGMNFIRCNCLEENFTTCTCVHFDISNMNKWLNHKSSYSLVTFWIGGITLHGVSPWKL